MKSAQYEESTAKLKADVPQLEAIISKPGGKEDELKQLKSELAALDRKITAALAPKHDEKDGEEVNHTETQRAEVINNQSHANDSKESMVAEPLSQYQREHISPHIIGGHYATPTGGYRSAAPKLR